MVTINLICDAIPLLHPVAEFLGQQGMNVYGETVGGVYPLVTAAVVRAALMRGVETGAAQSGVTASRVSTTERVTSGPFFRRSSMNDDRSEGMWKNLKGKIREQWGKLTDDDMDQAEGKWEQLSGRIQERYGRTKDDVELEMRRFRDEHDREPQHASNAPE